MFSCINLKIMCVVGWYNVWQKIICIGLLFQLIANWGLGEGALRHVNLIVEPPAVRRGQHATLKCLYDLNGAPLYSVKFYRGQLEFYRYSPGEIPKNKVFPFPGINVDISLSNASQVVIKNVGFGLSGNFSCEVTADAPYFSTATAFVQMQVVELPQKRPTLWAEHDRYEPGDVLRANCTSPPSRPKVELKFTLNNIMLHTGDTIYKRTMDNLLSSSIYLKLHLQSSHFTGAYPGILGGGFGGQLMNSISPGANNGLILRCTAQIGNLYQEYTEIELGIPQRDPIPARVTSSNAVKCKTIFLLTSISSIQSKWLSISLICSITASIHWIHSTCR